jgi:aspartate kinase
VTGKEEIEAAEIRAITQDSNLVRIRSGPSDRTGEIAGRLLEVLERDGVDVRFFHLSSAPRGGGTVSIMIPLEEKDAAIRAVASALPGDAFGVDVDIATISIVGQGLSGIPGIARKALASLLSIGIDPEIISTSGISLTIALAKDRVTEAVRKLHGDLGLGLPTRGEAP